MSTDQFALQEDKIMTLLDNRHEMTREIAQLASGTVANLCGSCDYEDIDAYTGAWIEWLMGATKMTFFPTWQDCHEQYASYLASQTLAAGFHIG
jgi:hypothetical protein